METYEARPADRSDRTQATSGRSGAPGGGSPARAILGLTLRWGSPEVRAAQRNTLDVVVDAHPATSMVQLADALGRYVAARDPHPGAAPAPRRIVAHLDGRALPARSQLAASPLRHGAVVELTPDSGFWRSAPAGPPAVTARDHEAGPGVGLRRVHPTRRTEPRPAATRLVVPGAEPAPALDAGPALLIASGLVGATIGLYLATQRPATLALALAAPLAYVFAEADRRRRQAAAERRRRRQHRGRLAAFVSSARQLHERETAWAEDEFPDLATRIAGIDPPSARLWERTQGDDEFLTVRLGRGRRRAGSEVDTSALDALDTDMAAEGYAAAAQVRDLDAAPIVVSLREVGLLALRGPSGPRQAVLRALVMDLALSHGPGALDIVAPPSERAAAGWLSWLPHATARDAGRTGGARVVLVRAGELCERALLERSARAVTAPSVGLWSGGLDDPVPPAAGAIATVEASGDGGAARLHVRFADRRAALDGVVAQTLEDDEADKVARRLAAYVDGSGRLPSWLDRWAGAAPAATDRALALGDLLELSGDSDGDVYALAAAWRRASLAPAVLGVTAHEVVRVDPLADEGVVVIAGGSAESQRDLLRSIALSLAAGGDPTRIGLVLVDGTGSGSTVFDGMGALAHVLALVRGDDLATLRRVAARVRALDEPDRPEAVVVLAAGWDRLAAEATELLASLSAAGATAQDAPRGAVGFVVGMGGDGGPARQPVVLRSTALPGTALPDTAPRDTALPVTARRDAITAAASTAAVPSDGDPADDDDATPFRAGAHLVRPDGALVSFQVAVDEPQRPTERLVRIGPWDPLGPQPARSGRAVAQPLSRQPTASQPAPAPSTQPVPAAAPVAERIVACARREHPTVRPLRWMTRLADRFGFDAVPASTDARSVPIGLADDVEGDRLVPVGLDRSPSRAWLVSGRAGTGRTELVRTVALSLMRDAADPAPEVYVVAASPGELACVAALPLVGAVIGAQETDRLVALATRLGPERPADARPACLLIDDLDEVVATAAPVATAALARLLAHGADPAAPADQPPGAEPAPRPWVVATCESPPAELDGVAWHRFELGAPGVAGAGADSPGGATIPGRGRLDGRAVQIMQFAAHDPARQAEVIAALAAHLPAEPAAAPVQAPTDHVPIPMDLTGALDVLVGLTPTDATPVRRALRGRRLLISGPAGSGRTSVLAGLAAQQGAAHPDAEVHLLASRIELDHCPLDWATASHGPKDHVALAHLLTDRLERDRPVILVVDDADDVLGSMPAELAELFRSLWEPALDDRLTVLAAASAFEPGAEPARAALATLRDHRFELVLQPERSALIEGAPPLDGTPAAAAVPARGVLIDGDDTIAVQAVSGRSLLAPAATGAAPGPAPAADSVDAAGLGRPLDASGAVDQIGA